MKKMGNLRQAFRVQTKILYVGLFRFRIQYSRDSSPHVRIGIQIRSTFCISSKALHIQQYPHAYQELIFS